MQADALVAEFIDQLTVEQLTERLEPISKALAEAAGPVALVVDARRMTGYDGEARAAFVDWHRTHRGQLQRVAIVTHNKLWHMVVRAMALASSVEMRPFDDPGAASSWAQGS